MYVCIFKNIGNSIWLRLLLLLSRKSTCFICMRGLPTGDWRGGRAGGSGARQTRDRAGTEKDGAMMLLKRELTNLVKLQQRQSQRGVRRMEKGNKWRRWWWLKWSWRWLRKICWQNICNFRKSSENIFCLSSETRRGKMFTAKPAGSKCPRPQTHPSSPHTSPFPTTRCTPRNAVYLPCPAYRSLFLPLPFWVWLIFAVLMFNFNIYTKHVRTCSCSRSEKFICYCPRDMPAVWTTLFLVPLSPSAAASLGGFYWQFDWKVAGSTCGVCLMRPLTCVEYLKVSNKWGKVRERNEKRVGEWEMEEGVNKKTFSPIRQGLLLKT